MACDDCGETAVAMIAMKPGRDGKPWELCGGCFVEGTKPMKLGMFKTTPISDPKLYDALASASERTAGLINMDRARGADDPKSSAGDFDRKPRASRKRKAS